MSEFIPIVMVLLVVIYGVKSAYKKQANVPHGMDEHFPFPAMEEERDDRPVVYQPIQVDEPQEREYYSLETLKEEYLEAMASDFSMSLARPTILAVEIDEEIEELDTESMKKGGEAVDFDLRQAVIYSEILNPKYVKDSGSAI